MANELELIAQHTETIYCIIRRRSDSYVYNVTDSAFEVWDNANITDYDVTMTGSGDYFRGDFPSGIAPGNYRSIFYELDTTPTISDDLIATQSILWDGYGLSEGSGTVTLSSIALLTLNEVKRFCGIPSSFTTDDDLIIELINGITSRFEEYTGRGFKARDYTEYQYISAKNIILRNYPLISVTSVSDSDDDDLTYGYTEDYDWDDGDEDCGIIRLASKYYDKMKIVYRAGYETIPEDVKLMAKEIIQEIYNYAQNHTSQDSENINGYSLVNSYDISANQMRRMDRFKKLSLA